MLPSVYKITCKPTKHFYIGSTKGNVAARWLQHIAHLNRGTHHSHKMQFEWSIFGALEFTFEIIEINIPFEDQYTRERAWIDALRPELNGERNGRKPAQEGGPCKHGHNTWEIRGEKRVCVECRDRYRMTKNAKAREWRKEARARIEEKS